MQLKRVTKKGFFVLGANVNWKTYISHDPYHLKAHWSNLNLLGIKFL